MDQQTQVWLIDFGPFGGATDPLLYSWEELAALGAADARDAPETEAKVSPADVDLSCGAELELRIVTERTSVRPAVNMVYRMPKDLFDLSSQQGIEQFAAAAARLEHGGGDTSDGEEVK